MIPSADVIAWGQVVPWTDPGMVEQDLVLSRGLVELYSDPALARGLALRGGTALHKLALARPGRYSEDIDLVQAAPGPIGPLLNGIRSRLDPWLGTPTRDQAASSVTLLYRFDSEVAPVRRLRLKVEINTREHFAVFGYRTRPFAVATRWFTGRAPVRTYALDELLATKLRALYQRRRGRDLFDLWDGLRRGRVQRARVVQAFEAYLKADGLRVTRAQFERNVAAKVGSRAFLTEVVPMAVAGVEYDGEAAADLVRAALVNRLPGEPWRGGRGDE